MRTSPLPSIAVLALLATVPAVCLFAQAPATPAPAAAPATPTVEAPAPAPAATTVPAPITPGRDAAGRNTLSVDFPDTDVRDILRNVADLFELNIVMPETLQGKTTIKLRDVTWRQIFQNVLEPVGYTYLEDGNIIKIVSRDSINEEPITTEVFIINYAKATDIMPTITSLVDPAKGKIVVDVRSNSIVISERPTRISRIRPIIEQLDRATDQVVIESKFVEVTATDAKNIGVNWTSLKNYNLRATNLEQDVSRGRRQDTTNGSDVRNGTDTQRTNGTTASSAVTTNNGVNNSTTNTSGQTNGSTNSGSMTSTNGIPTSTSTTGSNSSLTNTTNVIGTTTSGNSNNVANGTNNAVVDTLSNAVNLFNSVANAGATERIATALFSAADFGIVLSALQEQGGVKVISNPTIMTLNNTEAQINVGEEYPIPNYTYNQERGSFEVSGFNYKQIGVILKVTPQVNGKGDIKLTLAPEVSQRGGSVNFGGAANSEIPIIATRKAITQVSLKDGFTMGIGGMLTTRAQNAQTKVPVLGSVPVLGRLFRHDSRDTESKNLIIFITAKTVSSDGAPLEQAFDSERVRQLRIQQKDLPGYRDGTTPFVEPPPVKGQKITSAKQPRSGANK
ncbi:MAG: secretin N-terminal domain-containing protein [Opitutaceae bacterium]